MLDAVSRAQSRQRMQDQTWNEYYLRLAAYKEKYGDCLVPKKFEEDAKLASWVENQRVLYNRDYKPRSSLSSTVAASAQPKMEAPEPNSIEAKSPEEWAVEMSGATEEDAAEVAATMAEATMEVVNDVVDDAAIAEMAAVAAAANDAAGAAVAVPEDPTKGKKLSLERKEKLDALGFVWSLRSKRVDDHWDLSTLLMLLMNRSFSVFMLLTNLCSLLSHSVSTVGRIQECAWRLLGSLAL